MVHLVSRPLVGDFRRSHSKIAPNTGGLGEPLNVIVSGHSDDTVLVDSQDNGGFRNYMMWVAF